MGQDYEDHAHAFEKRCNLQLSEGDEIVTGQNGRVELVLNNRSVLRLDGNSHLRILALAKEEDTNGRQGAAFELFVGSLWTRIKKSLERPPQTDIHFPTSIAGVQGTAYRAVVAADSATNVRVYEGAVEMRQRQQGSSGISGPPKKVEGPREVPGPQKVTLEAWIKLTATTWRSSSDCEEPYRLIIEYISSLSMRPAFNDWARGPGHAPRSPGCSIALPKPELQ